MIEVEPVMDGPDYTGRYVIEVSYPEGPHFETWSSASQRMSHSGWIPMQPARSLANSVMP